MKKGWLNAVIRTLKWLFTHYTGTFTLIMLITLTSTLFSVSYLATLDSELSDIWDNDVLGGDAVQTALVALGEIESNLKDRVLWSDEGTRNRALRDIRGARSTLQRAMEAAGPRFYTPKAKNALAKTQNDLKPYWTALDSAQSKFHVGSSRAEWNHFQAASDLVRADLTLLVANRSANSSIGVENLVSRLRISLGVTLVILALSVIVRITLYWIGHPQRTKRRSPKRLD